MLSFQLFRNVEVCSKTFKKRNFRILWTPVGTGLSTPRDGAITARPKAGRTAKATHWDTSTFVTSCPIGMYPADSCCEGRVSLHFTQPGLSMPAAAGVVDEKGSEYILAHTGPRELEGVWVGVWSSSRLYYSFGKGPGQH